MRYCPHFQKDWTQIASVVWHTSPDSPRISPQSCCSSVVASENREQGSCACRTIELGPWPLALSL